MDMCDICGEVIQGDLQVVEEDRVQLASAALGVLDKTMGEFVEKLGMPRAQLATTWLKRQEDTTIPLDLCPRCALRIKRNGSIAGACYEALTSQIYLKGKKHRKSLGMENSKYFSLGISSNQLGDCRMSKVGTPFW